MKKAFYFVGVLAVVGMLFSCSAKNKNGVNVKVIETIPNISEPNWVKGINEFWENKGNYYYRGLSEGMTNIEAAKRSAGASARVSLAEQIKNTVRNEFSKALEAAAYDENTGGYLKDVFFSVVDNLTLSGVVIKETFTQRLSETSDTGSKTYYRSYVLAQVSIADYKKMLVSAFSKTNAQVSANKSAKELAKETEERFWKEQEKQSNENN